MGYGPCTNEAGGGSSHPWGRCGSIPIRHLRPCVARTGPFWGESWKKAEILLHIINCPPAE
jgi:hypothetical protein